MNMLFMLYEVHILSKYILISFVGKQLNIRYFLLDAESCSQSLIVDIFRTINNYIPLNVVIWVNADCLPVMLHQVRIMIKQLIHTH